MSNTKQGLLYLRDAKNTELVLKVKRENITTERNFKITEQEMYSNNSTHHRTNYYHNGSDGLSFACTVIFTKKDTSIMKKLDAWYRDLHPFRIVFGKSLNLKLPLVSKKWIITKLSHKQEADTLTYWSITFRTYNPPKKIKKVENELLSRTSKAYKWQHKCKKQYWKLNYKKQSQKKWPKSDCVKLLNGILIELGYMKKQKKKVKTGKTDKKGRPKKKTVKYVPNIWVHGKKKRGRSTSSAVILFKKQWNKYKLKPKIKSVKTDKIDKNTYTALGKYKKLKSAKKKK
jgi:hypothetical protein